jgi:hypothetical protein
MKPLHDNQEHQKNIKTIEIRKHKNIEDTMYTIENHPDDLIKTEHLLIVLVKINRLEEFYKEEQIENNTIESLYSRLFKLINNNQTLYKKSIEIINNIKNNKYTHFKNADVCTLLENNTEPVLHHLLNILNIEENDQIQNDLNHEHISITQLVEYIRNKFQKK